MSVLLRADRYRRAFRHVGIVFYLLLLCACGDPPQALLADSVIYTAAEASGTGLTSYQDETYPFTIDLPSDWFIQEVEDDTYAVLVVSNDSEIEDRAMIAVVVEALDNQAQLSDVIATAEQTLAAQYDIEEFDVDLARSIRINRVAGEERIYAYRVDQAPVRQRTAYIRDGTYLYTISLLASPPLSSRYAELFDGVLASFTGA